MVKQRIEYPALRRNSSRMAQLRPLSADGLVCGAGTALGDVMVCGSIWVVIPEAPHLF